MNHELLHAYFDGGLDAGQAADVERALAADPTLRVELDRIEAVDGALAMFGGIDVGEAFTERCLRAVQVDDALDLLPGHEAPPQFAADVVRATRPRRGVLLRIGLPVTAAAALLIAVLAFRGDPEAPTRDAPVAEYRWEVDTETFESLDLQDLEADILEELEAT